MGSTSGGRRVDAWGLNSNRARLSGRRDRGWVGVHWRLPIYECRGVERNHSRNELRRDGLGAGAGLGWWVRRWMRASSSRRAIVSWAIERIMSLLLIEIIVCSLVVANVPTALLHSSPLLVSATIIVPAAHGDIRGTLYLGHPKRPRVSRRNTVESLRSWG